MAGRLLYLDSQNLYISFSAVGSCINPTTLDSNSPPPTSSPLQTDSRHGDTAMLDSPADTPDRQTSRPFIEPAARGEGGPTSNATAGPSGVKNGGKDGKERDPFGAPGSCWKGPKYREEVARCESVLLHQDWSMSTFFPEFLGALDPNSWSRSNCEQRTFLTHWARDDGSPIDPGALICRD